MALFTVNRYVGPDEQDDAEKASPLMSKLEEAIRQRKASRLSALKEKSVTSNAEDKRQRSASRSAKRRHSSQDEPEIVGEVETHEDEENAQLVDGFQGVDEELSKKKKKKRKKAKSGKTNEEKDEPREEKTDRDGMEVEMTGEEHDGVPAGENEGSPGYDDAEDEEMETQTEKEESFKFQVLGRDSSRRGPTRLVSSLPEWLEYPTILSSQLQRHQVAVDSVPLSPGLRKALSKQGINTLFPGSIIF